MKSAYPVGQGDKNRVKKTGESEIQIEHADSYCSACAQSAYE